MPVGDVVVPEAVGAVGRLGLLTAEVRGLDASPHSANFICCFEE